MGNPEKLCSDCERLKRGLGSIQRPHQYLVRSYAGQAGNALTYRCLLCETAFAWERPEAARGWNRGSQARA